MSDDNKQGGIRAARGILPFDPRAEPPEVTIRRGRGDSDAELFDYMRNLWADEKEENARLNAENAVIAELEAVIHDYDARIEQWLKPFPGTETCDRCGRAMGIGFHVDDETWARICPDGNTSAVLCPWCADKRAKELGLTDVPTTFFIVFDVLRDSQEPYKGAWKQRALNAETELTALKERRCETCLWWKATKGDYGVCTREPDIPASWHRTDFCSEHEPAAQESPDA